MRFNELLSGVRAELAIKVFGDDFETLESVGREIERVVERTKGAADIQTEKTIGLPIMTIQPKLQVLAQYGLSLKELQEQLAVAMGGQVAEQFYQGDRCTDIVVRLARS